MPRKLSFLIRAQKQEAEKAKKEDAKETKKAVKKLKESVEKTTLGDISELANLKTALENKEKKS